jgi:outer membrane protein assembly factor BamB
MRADHLTNQRNEGLRRQTWFSAGGDNSRRGVFPGRVEVEPKPIRRLTAQGSIQASCVFDSRARAFVADMAGGVQAFAADGRALWQKRLDGGISATAVVHPDEKRLFTGTHAGFALDAQSGAVLWRTEIETRSDSRILSDLLLLPGQAALVLSSWGGRYVALDVDGGKVKHSWTAGISPSSGATADADENIYCVRAVAKTGLQFVRVDPNGVESVLYQEAEKGRPATRLLVAAAPVVDQERKVVYFVSNVDRTAVLIAWSLETKSTAWTHDFRAAVAATPSVAENGMVVVADMRGFVHGLSPDGSLLYRYASGGDYLLAGAVCDSSGAAFIGDPTGVLHRIPLDGLGTRIYETPRSVQARPSFDSRGNLYVPATDGKVYVFANRQPPPA